MNDATHTFIGVTLGAMLATLGGFFATQMNAARQGQSLARQLRSGQRRTGAALRDH